MCTKIIKKYKKKKLISKEALSKNDERENYKKYIWKKNWMIIIYYAKIFIEKMKLNNKLNQLKLFHFKILNELSIPNEENQLMDYETKKTRIRLELMKMSHTNALKVITTKHFLSIFKK